MAFDYKDYYKVLGVSRDASADEIRKCYRRLARKHHPDLNPGNKQSEETFKGINEAYEVLSDPAKRKRYDDLGADWEHGQSFQMPPGYERRGRQAPPVDFHFGGTGFSSFFESIFGGGESRWASGSMEHKGRDVEGEIMITLEEAFHGGTRSITVTHGGREETYHLKIPPGMRPGSTLKLGGRGGQGVGGGQRGDLLLHVHVASHPQFHLEEDDLVYDLDLAPWEAVLGAEIPISTLSHKLNLKIPPGTQNGTRMRLRGQGFQFGNQPRGDLIVQIHIEVPDKVSDEEKGLWEKLARTATFHARP